MAGIPDMLAAHAAGTQALSHVRVGARVAKVGGDYSFEGEIVAVFAKRNGVAVRVVVEDDRGILMIMNERQLKGVT